jgi:hypoxanthine-DNA glycosylase
MNTSQQQGFAAIAQVDAQLLILGSMPSALSLAKQRYYAHPRNAFWQIMARLCDFDPDLSYPEKICAMQQQKIALWDVIQGCQRQGSLDSHIERDSIIVNDFGEFFAQHSKIQQLFFNGSCAEREYRKRVLPTLATPWRDLPCTRLPSTSPAMASLTLEQKLAAWKEIARWFA